MPICLPFCVHLFSIFMHFECSVHNLCFGKHFFVILLLLLRKFSIKHVFVMRLIFKWLILLRICDGHKNICIEIGKYYAVTNWAFIIDAIKANFIILLIIKPMDIDLVYPILRLHLRKINYQCNKVYAITIHKFHVRVFQYFCSYNVKE